MDRKIGVIGGMGPMASQLFYKYVTEMTDAACDQEHVRMIIYSDSEMPDRTGAILRGEYEEVYSRMLEDAKALENCGCEAIAITCNTAHFFGDMIADKLHIPIIHMIRETTAKIAGEQPGAKVAVLATDGTIKTGLYQKHMEAAGLIPYAPEPEIQKEVMHQIYDRVKAGLPWDEPSWERIEKAVKDAGCSKAILGCTELPIIKRENNLDDYYVDPMEVLAEKVIEFSGKKLKKNK